MSKALPWFRFYGEAIDDPKVQRLAPHLFRTWVNLLCVASQNEGRLPSIDDIAFRLRMSAGDAKQHLDDLILAGLIDIAPDGTLHPHNWSVRQFSSDSSTERVRKHRAKRACNVSSNVPGNVSDNVTGAVTVTPPDSDPESKFNSLPPEQEAVRAVAVARELKKVGLGRGGGVSAEARRKVATRLRIATADPLVEIYDQWPASRSARDPDALFVASADTLHANASEAVKAACKPIDAHADPPQPAPAARPSAELVKLLGKPRGGRRA